MKLGILTQPLTNNYGGLLQCFALQKVLKNLGHDVWVIQRVNGNSRITYMQQMCVVVKQLVKILMGRRIVRLLDPGAYITWNTTYFAFKYITPKTHLITDVESLRYCHHKEKYDGYVVGSDQVWRPRYSPCITNYFLDFLSPDEKVKRVAYAASFGVDEWEFTENETKVCQELAKEFDAISVRENSAVVLCEKYLNRNGAMHVLDPTMLLEKEDYITLVEKEKEPKSPGNLFCYILDESSEKKKIIESIASEISAVPFTKMPKCKINHENLRDKIEDCVYPSVTAWLRGFMDAEMVVTDSFHGCVFSIIFNKPFWVLGNKKRGMARFESLLSIFGLDERLIKTDSMSVELTLPIDWGRVNAIKKEWQEKSFNFLKGNL